MVSKHMVNVNLNANNLNNNNVLNVEIKKNPSSNELDG